LVIRAYLGGKGIRWLSLLVKLYVRLRVNSGTTKAQLLSTALTSGSFKKRGKHDPLAEACAVFGAEAGPSTAAAFVAELVAGAAAAVAWTSPFEKNHAPSHLPPSRAAARH
jgi:hypothetical protein